MDALRRLTPAAYAVALVFLLSPLVDVVTNVYPFESGSVQWRYGAVGIMSNYLISAVFGLLLATLVAALAGHVKVLWAAAATNLALAAVLVVIVGLFALDVLQLRNVVRPEAADMFKIGAAKAAFKLLVVAASLVLLGVAGLKAARAEAGTRRDRKDRKDPPLLVREG
jgi:hypothetical protein